MVEHLEKSMVSIYLDALFGELGEHSVLNDADGFLGRGDVLARPEIVKGGAEVFRYEKVEATAIYTFVVRANKSLVVQDDDFIEWNSVNFNIRAVRKKSLRKLFMENTLP